CVVGHRLDRLVGPPDLSRTAIGLACRLHPPAKMDIVDRFRPRKLPRISKREPFLGVFLLPAILDDLSEHPMVVADAITVGWDSETRQAFHEAGREPPQAAIAQSGVFFRGSHAIEIDS